MDKLMARVTSERFRLSSIEILLYQLQGKGSRVGTQVMSS